MQNGKPFGVFASVFVSCLTYWLGHADLSLDQDIRVTYGRLLTRCFPLWIVIPYVCMYYLLDWLENAHVKICQVVREKILTGIADSSDLAEAFPCCKQLFFRKKNHWAIKLEFWMFNVGFWYSFILICCWHLGFDLFIYHVDCESLSSFS